MIDVDFPMLATTSHRNSSSAARRDRAAVVSSIVMSFAPDMWGPKVLIAGNVTPISPCLNKVELLPWDGWGMMPTPYDSLSDETTTVLDDVAALSVSDDFDSIRERY